MISKKDTVKLVGSTKSIVVTEPVAMVNKVTGEVQDVQAIYKIGGGQNFWKLYLFDFLSVLGVLDNKQVDVICYILEHTDPSSNTFIGTYKTIAQNVGCSEPTIAKVMNKLKSANFLKLVVKGGGVYAINPIFLVKGNENKRNLLIHYYNTADRENTNIPKLDAYGNNLLEIKEDNNEEES